MTRYRFLCLLIAANIAVSVIAAACDDGGGSNPDGAASPAPSAAPRSTLVPGVIDGNTFVSASKGYSVTFPEGWNPDENFFDTATYAIDAFIGPEAESGVQSNMTVRCDYITPETTLDTFIEDHRRVLEGFALGEVAEEEITFAGNPAVRLGYEQRSGDTDLRKTEILVIQGECGWTITTTQAASSNSDDLFEQMLASFQFTPAT